MRTRLSRILCASAAAFALACTLAPHLGRAQNTPGQRNTGIDTYAITNARVVPVAGPELARATVVVRNGLIAAVGANVNAPADARVIDGTGLTVYPGLIDANTTLGLPQQTPRPGGGGGGGFAALLLAQQQATPPPGSSPNSTQPPGLQPEVVASDLVRPGGDQIEAARNAGLTAALTVPREGIFTGQSALVNLAGDTPQQMLVRAPVALHIQFTPLRGGTYPSSLMGVFAAVRQMFLDAQRYREWQTVYARNPRGGVRRPELDKSLQALLPVLARELPVVMYADRQREIERALDLAQEFNLRAIIAGGAESWLVADRLAAAKVPVLLSLNYPRRTTAPNAEADPDPLRVLRERVEAPKTAAKLAAAGVRFAFQSGGLTNPTDYLANVARSVENGLARDEAIRAMTLRAAEILDAESQLGTIEPGKIANLTVTRGDIFDRNRRIAYVFIDGRPVELRPATPAGGGGATSGGMAAGTWSMRVTTQGQPDRAVTLTLQQEGERLTGSIQGDLGAAQIANASVGSGGEFRFTAPVTLPAQTIEATFEGTITGNEMRGTVTITGGQPGSFTATRASAPPGARPATTPPGGAAPSGAGGATAVDLSGTWTLSVQFGANAQTATLNLQQQGEGLSGTLQSQLGSTEISNGSAGADGSFRFTTVLNFGGQTVEVSYAGTVTGNRMTGTAATPRGSAPFTGTRQP
ncbi:MAG TPA: amidohydrolase family protein [Pyrinomonadaceae bacterium]|jgi:imidazolonepropionase-like amidohydrolase